MTTLELFPELGTSTLSAGDSPANHFQLQENKEEKTTTVISGLQCLRLSKESGLLGSLERTLLVSSNWDLTLCYLTWKARVTPAGRLLFRLWPSARRTVEIGSGLWPTPTAATGGADHNSPSTKAGKRFAMNLAGAVQMWPTPVARMWKDSGYPSEYNRNEIPLAAQVGGPLNPTWVEWLMGYPAGWTDLKPSEMPLSRRLSKKSVEQ